VDENGEPIDIIEGSPLCEKELVVRMYTPARWSNH